MNDKSFRQTGILSFFCILILLFCVSELCFTAQETLTLTTYYPAPFGMYKEMRADQMAIGSAYRHNPLYDGLLIVNGTVAIGTDTPAPGVQLEVSADTGGITGGIIRSTKTGGGYIEMYAMEYGSNPYGVIGTEGAGGLSLNPGGGNVAIGPTIPDDLLDIKAVDKKAVIRLEASESSIPTTQGLEIFVPTYNFGSNKMRINAYYGGPGIGQMLQLNSAGGAVIIGDAQPKVSPSPGGVVFFTPRPGDPDANDPADPKWPGGSGWNLAGALAFSDLKKMFYYNDGDGWYPMQGAGGSTGGGCYVSYGGGCKGGTAWTADLGKWGWCYNFSGTEKAGYFCPYEPATTCTQNDYDLGDTTLCCF